MKIDLSFSAGQFDDLQLRDKNVVVLDVLRASSTITVALNNGAREIIPVASIESAVKISGSLFGEVTLRGGERNGKIIEGFNLGNSPLEYSEAAVKGKSIIYCTTNGSVAMAKSRYARMLIVGSFLNLTTMVDFIREEKKDFLFICAGRLNSIGYFSLEDAVCAGMMIQKLMKDESLELHLSDSAKAAHALYKSFGRSILKMLKTSEHGKYLSEIGFADDLKICAAVDSVPVLPVQIENKIKLKKEEPPVVSA
ncbi:MAG: 2-phosphosulfolactate phosphatase [Ignavibacteriales bacterium]|nr:2-phosphosulfolactate phosphatase [Ignavibacteriales bacterium]